MQVEVEEDDCADAMGVIHALERTCELEAKLRQAIQDTHPLTTTLDWDFSAADKEREALFAISEQLEYLEDKLREYRNTEWHESDNKAVVLSQLDSVRRELLEVTQNCAAHITFGKEVVKEVLQFATLSDGGVNGGGGTDENGGGDGTLSAAGVQSPMRFTGASSRAGLRRPLSSGAAEGGLPFRRGLAEAGGDRSRGGSYGPLLGVPSRRRDGSPGTLVSPGGARSLDPSRGSSPSTQHAPGQHGFYDRTDGYGGGGGTRGIGQEPPAASPSQRPPSGRAHGDGHAGGALRQQQAPRRQINLDIAAVKAAGTVAGAGGSSAGELAPTVRGGGPGVMGAAVGPSPPPSLAAGGRLAALAAAEQQEYYQQQMQQGGGGSSGSVLVGGSAGGGSNSARQGGGSSRPSSARTHVPSSQSDPPSSGSRGGYYAVAGSRGGSGQGDYGAGTAASAWARGEVGSGILSRLDPPGPVHRQHAASPISLRSEDIYGAVNGGRATGGGGSSGVGGATQAQYGGMVRIRDMLDRAEADLSRVQEERDARRSPAPPRIFGDGVKDRFDDAVNGGSDYYSPSYSASAARTAAPPSMTTHTMAAASSYERTARGGEDARGGAIATRAYSSGARVATASQGPATSGDTRGGGGAGESSGGGRRRGWGLLGRLVRRLAGVVVAGAAVAVGVAAVGAVVKWKREKPPRRPNTPTIDLPPWLARPPPGSPQRSPRGSVGKGTGGPPAAGPQAPRRDGASHKPKPSSGKGREAGPGTSTRAGSRVAGSTAGGLLHLPLQSPVTHVQPLPEGDLFPSMPPPDVNAAKG